MKNAHVSTTKGQATNGLAALRKVSVNPELHPAKVISIKNENRLSIQGCELREWLEHLTGSNGVYFLDMDVDRNSYSMHFQHHASGKLMTLDCQEDLKASEDPRKEFLESMLFDLSLFPEEPILVFDSDMAEQQLGDLAAIYYEHAKDIDCIIGRSVNIDLKKLFEMGIYKESRIKEISVNGIYHGLYPGTSIHYPASEYSYAMALIFRAIQSVFYQVVGKKVMALV